MLRVAGVPWLGTCSSYPPKTDPGKAVLGQLLTASRAWLWALPDRNIPQVGFRQSNKINKKTRKQGTEVLAEGSCSVFATKVLWAWIDFWRAVRRIFLRESHRISCPVAALSWFTRGSLCHGLALLVGGFSHFLFSKLFLERMLLASLQYWYIICVCDSGLFCSRHCPQDVC